MGLFAQREPCLRAGLIVGIDIVGDFASLARKRKCVVHRKHGYLLGDRQSLGLVCVENAGRRPASVYRDSVLYTTLSPCAMCSGAILLYGIPRLVVGENRTFLGEEALLESRGVEVTVLQDPRCIEMMTTFIGAHPELWNEDIGE